MKRISLLFFASLVFFGVGLSFSRHQWFIGNGEAKNETSVVQEKVGSATQIIASDLDIPWEIVVLPDGDLLVTERSGRLKKIGIQGAVIPIEGVVHQGEGGLLGLALHPAFQKNHLIYLYLTTKKGDSLINRVDRYRLDGTVLTKRMSILTDIPGASYHDGGRIAFGPDGYLYITTGDAGNENLAQNVRSLAGKILRITDNGKIPVDNPFKNAVYSLGHRNAQGITWDRQGRMWATEHGRSGILSGLDELNLIEKGKNYGWPLVQGDQKRKGMRISVLHSGAKDTWAPADIVAFEDRLFFTGLRGEALYEVRFSSKGKPKLAAHFKNEFGRLRALELRADGTLYVSTSNRDGRGTVEKNDDRIIRIDLKSLASNTGEDKK